ncbi:phage GP46 family protein [Salinarimonas sp.]|uniref:phage GP46 family protein n=1 Tax=Salinarimonas sp. TaxID=2766526 RepID=UPI00391C2A95
MTDFVTAGAPEAVTLDWLLAPTGLPESGRDLESAIAIALLTDGLARPDDRLPRFDDDDRRGWWADRDAREIWGAPPIGSRLWLLSREKRMPEVLARAEQYARDALAFLTSPESRIATRVVVEASFFGEAGLALVIRIERGQADAIELRFQVLWDIYGG